MLGKKESRRVHVILLFILGIVLLLATAVMVAYKDRFTIWRFLGLNVRKTSGVHVLWFYWLIPLALGVLAIMLAIYLHGRFFRDYVKVESGQVTQRYLVCEGRKGVIQAGYYVVVEGASLSGEEHKLTYWVDPQDWPYITPGIEVRCM